MLFQSLLKCKNCGYTFRGRNERGKIKYRCNNKLKNGIESCTNNSAIEEEGLLEIIKKQFDFYEINLLLNNEYLKTIIKEIVVESENSYIINYINKELKPTEIKNNKISFGTLN